MTTRNIIAFLLSIGISVHGQINTFLKTYTSTPGYTTTQNCTGLDTMSKNSFVTIGSKFRWQNNPNDTLLLDGYLQKTEVSGLTKWIRMYHLNGYALAFKDVKVTANKEILCVGQTNDFGTQNGNIKHGIIMKTDSNGYVLWCRLYPCQKIFKLLKMSDGNITVIASDSGSFYGKYLKVVRLDPAGNTLWCKRLLPADTNGYTCQNVVEGKNKSILIVSNYARLTLLDSSGNHVKDIIIAPSSWIGKGFHRAINNFNNGFYIVGYNKGNASNLGSTILKTDAMLNVLWYKTYESLGGDSEFHNLVAFSPNNILVLCEPENYGTTQNLWRFGYALFDSTGLFRRSNLFMTDSWPILPGELLRLPSNHLLFTAFNNQESYFGIVDTISSSFCNQTQITWSNATNPSPIIANHFSSVNYSFTYSLVNVYTYQPFDFSITYNCSSGPTGPLDTTAVGIPEEDISNQIQLYPSPCSDFFTVQMKSDNKESGYVNVKLLNSLGQLLLNNRFPLQAKKIMLDTRPYQSGLYYLVCEFENKSTIVKKVIIQK